MKTILSWDVGIKNLAYCVIQKDEEKSTFSILKWGIIDLNEGQQKCQFMLRTGNNCQEVAKCCIYHKDKIPLFENNTNYCDNAFSCTKHKEKIMPTIAEIMDPLPKSKKQQPVYPDSCILCTNKPSMILTGTSFCWCDEHYEKKGKSFVKKVASKRVSVVTCKKQPIQDIAEKLAAKLDTIFEDLGDISEVLIENQPTFKNPKMKTLSSFLYFYFILRGMVDKKNESKITEVRFVSPSNKLKVNSKNTNNLMTSEKTKEKANVYKLTKSLGVKYCRALIDKHDEDILNEYKKKDDICDAFLQGFQYLFTPVPQKYFDKLEKIGVESASKPIKNNNINDSEDISDNCDNDNCDDVCDECNEDVPQKIKKVKKVKKT
jgi:hypothetical protein